MTNRERAKELDNQIMLNGRLRQGDQSVDLIERALDEAEKRGKDFYYRDLIQEGVKIDRRQYADGQKEMRERAANIAKTEEEPTSEDFPMEAIELFLKSPAHSMMGAVSSTKKNIEKRIRALTIEGE